MNGKVEDSGSDTAIEECKMWRKIERLDDDERAIFEALEATSYEWRTVGSLSQECNIPEDRVNKILFEHRQLITSTNSEKGYVYTLKEKKHQREKEEFENMNLRGKIHKCLSE